MKRLFLTLCPILLSALSFSQTITTEVTSEITVCGNSETFTIQVVNDSPITLTGVSMNVGLPTGISYQVGSVNEITSFSVQESNISNLSAPAFSTQNLAPNDTVAFSISIAASTEAVSFQQQGNVFRNEVEMTASNGSTTHLSNPYNILFPSLNILNVLPTSQSVISGDTVTRGITIVNAGYGRTDEIKIAEAMNNIGLELIQTEIGTSNTTNDTITINGLDFSTIGNGDGYFDSGESITVNAKYLASGCEAHTITSSLTAIWGCDGNEIATPVSYGNVTLTLRTPSINVQADGSISSCFGSEASGYSLVLTNTGQGIATNVDFEIYKSTGSGYNEDIFSSIDPTSFTYQIGSSASILPFTPTTYPTRSDGPYSCLGANPVGRIYYQLPFQMQPGESVTINWDMYQCCISDCQNEGNMGWEYEVNYQNYCLTDSYSNSDIPEEETELNFTLFSETPSDISDGETQLFNFVVSTYDNNLPQDNGAHYEVEFELESGLTILNPATALSFKSNGTEWQPFDVQYNALTNQIVGRYLLPAPFVIPKAEVGVWVTGDCSQPSINSGAKSVSLNISYIPNITCNSGCVVEMVCDQTVTVDLHCPGENCEGLRMNAFELQRTSFGLPDNNLDGLADATGSLDMSEVKTRRVMVNDTLRATFFATVHSQNSTQYENLFAQSTIEEGQNLLPVGTSVRIYDASEGNYLNCDSVGVAFFNSGSNRVFRFNMVPAQLVSSAPDLASSNEFGHYVFEEGDSVWFNADYVLSGNIGGAVQEVLVDNEMFLSGLESPWTSGTDRWFCDTYNGKFTMIGYFFANSWSSNYNVKTCSKTVQQNFWFSVGNCCDNYDGGNLFPYEYRNWAHINELELTIPSNYNVLGMWMRQKRTKRTNSVTTENVASITPYYDNGTTMRFNLEQYYHPFGGTMNFSDDGFSGTVYVELAPTCDVPVNTYEDIEWKYKFTKSEFLGGGETDWITSTPDRIKFTPTELVLSSTNPYVDGLGRNVTWNLNVKNNTSNSDAANSWVRLNSPTGTLDFVALLDENGDTLQMQGDIFPLGTINRNQSRNLSIVAKYGACAPDYMVAYAGYECSAYPDSFAYFTCPYTTYGLQVEPKSAGQQARISGTTVGNDCSNLVEITVELASVEFGHLDSIEVNIDAVGESMTFVPGSGELDFPMNGSFISIGDPVSDGFSHQYKLMEESEALKRDGLPGVLSLPNNKLRLRFQMNVLPEFAAGHSAVVSFSSKEMCGREIPPISLAYDPSIVLVENTASGLSNDASNTWGVAWIDYNNDGFEDLFATEYGQNSGNFLYTNNGNGTFTKETSGALVTDANNSVSSTWGDYDNDGDIDVFISNNVGGVNKLYTNNGDGTFTKGTEGDINTYGGYCHNAAWADYDNDGDIDLFVTDFMPTKFNRLYENQGDGTFTVNADQILSAEPYKSIGATWGDYDSDGYIDLFVPNANGQNNALYHNEGNGQFSKVTVGDIVNDGGNSVGCSWGDFNNDGFLDLFVANTSTQADFLYKNNGNGTFTKVTQGPVVTEIGHSSGSSWIDIDNDGDLDLFVSRDMGNPSRLFTNNGDGTFSVYDNPINAAHGNSYPNAWGDYDNDGDLDCFIGNRDGETNTFFTNNRASCNSWFCAKLQGTVSNRSGIGAKVRVKASVYGQEVWQLREISSQTGGGAGSQNSMRTTFGLGDATVVDSVIIEWPSGVVQYLTNQPVNGCSDVIEPTGNYVCGTVFFDDNANGIQDENEGGIPNQMLVINPGLKYVATDENGNYSLYLEDGNYSIEQIIEGDWLQTYPINNQGLNFNVVGTTNCDLDFGNDNPCTSPDLAVNLGATALRRGFINQLTLSFSNNSPTPAENVELTVELPQELFAVSATSAWQTAYPEDSTTVYTWFIDELLAFESVNLTIEDSVDLFADLEKMVVIKTSISSLDGDCELTDNSTLLVEEIVGSVDPNDKLVYPRRADGIQQITVNERLHYTIRYQNVGNYYASQVIIKDTLSPFLDISTIKFESQTHDFDHSLENGILTWRVYDIFLPDSATDLAGSQGAVKFSALPNKNTPHNTLINNTAAIQFDYNPYLITNTVQSKLIHWDQFSALEIIVSVYPNPATDNIKVSAETSDGAYVSIARANIYAATGTLMLSQQNTDDESMFIDIGNLDQGLYQLEIYDAVGRRTSTKLVKL